MKTIIIVLLITIITLVKGQSVVIKVKYIISIKDTILFKNAIIGSDFVEILKLLNDVVNERDTIVNQTNDINSKYCIDLLNAEFNTKLFSKAKFIRYSLFDFVNIGRDKMFVSEFNFESSDLQKVYNILNNWERNYFISERGNRFRFLKWKNSIYFIYFEGLFSDELEDYYQTAFLFIK